MKRTKSMRTITLSILIFAMIFCGFAELGAITVSAAQNNGLKSGELFYSSQNTRMYPNTQDFSVVFCDENDRSTTTDVVPASGEAKIPFSVTVEATDDNFGELAYSYLTYIDQNLREREAGSNQEVVAAEFLFEQLESFGYAPEYQRFSDTMDGITTNSQNIIVTKPGKSEKTIIVGAHYDSVDTAGVDDNGSGVSVALETAKRMYNVETPYTIVFVFFGAEEIGCVGSAEYVNSMTQEDIANTICMINIDTVFAGTYRYMYSGTAVTDANDNVVVELSWPFYQAMKISDEFHLGMRSNDTELNYDYPSPTTGPWSDHQSFCDKNIPYLYFEASNWELPDDKDDPQYGSSGAYETEIGEVMHVKGKDDLTFIETTWGTRGKDTLTAYCKLLSELLVRMEPYALLNVLGEYEDESELESEYDGGFVHVDVNETVTVYFEGPANSVIGVFDENGELVSSESVYAAGKWKTMFTVSTSGIKTFSICCYRDGEWSDTQMEAKLIFGDVFYTENTLKVLNITADNVTPKDKTDLEKAKADYEQALEDNGDDYTEDAKKLIEDEIKRIDDVLKVIENVAEVEKKIGELPETITKDDEAAIKAAEDAYNALSDYEKSLVDEDAKKALDEAKAALAKLNNLVTDLEPQHPVDNPSDDNDGLGTVAIVAIVIGSCAVVGGGGFALFRFVIRKKKRSGLAGNFKK